MVPYGRIAVRTAEHVLRDRTIVQGSAPWDDILPQIERGAELARDLSRFHEFIKATNQIERLLRDAEIFPYEIISGPDAIEGQERITIRERSRTEYPRVLSFLHLHQALIAFLHPEQIPPHPTPANVL